MFGFEYYFAVLMILTGEALAGYADGSGNSENDLNHGPPPVNAYGYSGSFSGTGAPPNIPIPQFDFSGFLGNYLDSLSRYHQEFLKKGGGAFSYSRVSSSPNANAKAQSSLTFKPRKYGIQAQAQGGQPGYGQPGGFSGGFGGSYSGGNDGANQVGYSGPAGGGGSWFPIPQGGGGSYGFGPSSGGSSASASFGPEGVHQTASVYPENPNSPNINTRFGGGSEFGGQPGGGFRSVFTSSQSQTANVDGKPVTLHKASTTVNDNGKITTYTAKNP